MEECRKLCVPCTPHVQLHAFLDTYVQNAGKRSHRGVGFVTVSAVYLHAKGFLLTVEYPLTVGGLPQLVREGMNELVSQSNACKPGCARVPSHAFSTCAR